MKSKVFNNQQSPTTLSHQMGKLVEGSRILTNFPQVCEIVNAFEGTGKLVVKAKEAVVAESLPRNLREIYQCYIKLVDEIQRAESTTYTVAQAYESGYTFKFGSNPAKIKL